MSLCDSAVAPMSPTPCFFKGDHMRTTATLAFTIVEVYDSMPSHYHS